MAFIALNENERFGPVTGTATIFGTSAGRETVAVANGDFTFDGSYNTGGDTILIGGNARDFTVARSGSSVVLRSSATTVTLPLSATGATTLTFNDTTLSVRFDQPSGTTLLGTQTVTTTAAAVAVPASNAPVPVVVVAGQSNAEITGLDSYVYDALATRGGAFEFVHRAVGGTSLFANAGPDWDPASNELLAQLIAGVNAATANVRAQGGVPDIRILWVQGEADLGRSAAEYQTKLTAFIAALRAGIGAADAAFTIALLPFDSSVRTAQLAIGQAVARVDTLETIGARTFDGVHYDRDTALSIAERFIADQAITTPRIGGYRNTTPVQTVTVDAAGVVTVSTPAFGSVSYVADNRPHIVRTGNGDDYIVGGAGDDQFFTGVGHDTIVTGNGNNVVDAGHGNDTIVGGASGDFILGRFGSDWIDGGGGDDTIGGGDQNDVIYGGSGNDLLYGELGADVISTGPGSDRVGYNAVAESVPGAADVITDFTPGQDRLDLAAIDANVATPADDAFRFIGTAAFSGAAGEVRYTVNAGIGTLEADVNGDRVADFVVTFSGAPAITATDIVL